MGIEQLVFAQKTSLRITQKKSVSALKVKFHFVWILFDTIGFRLGFIDIISTKEANGKVLVFHKFKKETRQVSLGRKPLNPT